ncbi:hypothetical protein CYMTET_56668 [Cymbomonas tetramitiformis]|uniref:Uncharacterized protein n=1 Tax=Cymbomonas tetramitiformis TaxID=36881 RepID=A0AAE0BBR2_9CHLO|nr:hypothetical protein CYMTET_56668 [Cymbomonas tetramitiformis]
MRCFTLFIFLVLSAARGDEVKVKKDICDPSVSHFEKAEHQAIACYAGKFLLKMLTEVIAGETKSVSHVRAHLLPYLGGTKTLDALKTDKADDPTCTVCYSDTGYYPPTQIPEPCSWKPNVLRVCNPPYGAVVYSFQKCTDASEGLTSLRNELSAEQLKAYDDLNVCYPVLTERILRRLPTTEDGVNLQPHPFFKEAVPQVLTLFRPMLHDMEFTDNSCKKARATMPGPIKGLMGSMKGMQPHLNPHRSVSPRLSSAPFAGAKAKLPDLMHLGQKQVGPGGPGGPRPGGKVGPGGPRPGLKFGKGGLGSNKRPKKPSPEDLETFRQKVQEMREKRQTMKSFPTKADAVKSAPTKADEKSVEATAEHESKEKNVESKQESKQETNVAPEEETKQKKEKSGWSIFGK